VYVYADENSEFFDPLPAIRTTQVDTEGNTQTTTTTGVGSIMCQFGRFGETPAIYINTTVLKCVTPSIEDEPDSIYRETVKLTVAMNGQDFMEENSQVDFTFVGTGTYLVFWPFVIGALLLGLLIIALVVCCSLIFQSISLDDSKSMRHVGHEGRPHVTSIGNGVTIPRGRADWNAERSSVDMIGRAS
jgi:hypothetical protein